MVFKSKLSLKVLLIHRNLHSLTHSVYRASVVKATVSNIDCLEDDMRKTEEVLTSQNLPANN